MAGFLLSDLMFGDHGIANIPDISLRDRAAILAKVVHKLVEKGHDLCSRNDPLCDQEINQAINHAKAEVCDIFGSGNVSHNKDLRVDAAKLYH
jgi:hypothetical protein